VKPLADFSKVIVEDCSDFICLGRKAAGLFGFASFACATDQRGPQFLRSDEAEKERRRDAGD